MQKGRKKKYIYIYIFLLKGIWHSGLVFLSVVLSSDWTWRGTTSLYYLLDSHVSTSFHYDWVLLCSIFAVLQCQQPIATLLWNTTSTISFSSYTEIVGSNPTGGKDICDPSVFVLSCGGKRLAVPRSPTLGAPPNLYKKLKNSWYGMLMGGWMDRYMSWRINRRNMTTYVTEFVTDKIRYE
jgi:hypothetical protein